jgi:hypothetical protein
VMVMVKGKRVATGSEPRQLVADSHGNSISGFRRNIYKWHIIAYSTGIERQDNHTYDF